MKIAKHFEILISFLGLFLALPAIAQNQSKEIIEQIKKDGLGKRFVIAHIQPIQGHKSAGYEPITFAGPTNIGGDLSWVADGMSMAANEQVIRFTNKTTFMEETFSMGGTKVYCPTGIKGYSFESQTDAPLTFILLEKYGFVYVSGQGNVIFPNGQSVKLPKEDTMSEENHETILDLNEAVPIKEESFYIDVKDIAPEAAATEELYSILIMDRPNIKWPSQIRTDITYDCAQMYSSKNILGCYDEKNKVVGAALYKEGSKIEFVYSDPGQTVVFSSDELNRMNEIKEISSTTNSLTIENSLPLTEFPGDKILISEKSLKPIVWHIRATLRFVGEFKKNSYIFFGEGDQSNRLTFKIDESGKFRYISGKGRVITKDGKEFKLGY